MRPMRSAARSATPVITMPAVAVPDQDHVVRDPRSGAPHDVGDVQVEVDVGAAAGATAPPARSAWACTPRGRRHAGDGRRAGSTSRRAHRRARVRRSPSLPQCVACDQRNVGQVTFAASARSSASREASRDGRLQEADHAVDEVADRDRERQQHLARRASPFAVGCRVHDAARWPARSGGCGAARGCGPGTPQAGGGTSSWGRGSAGELLEHVAAARTGTPWRRSSCSCCPRARSARAAAGCAHSTDERRSSGWRSAMTGSPRSREPREAVLEDSLDEPILRAEVVLHRRVVAVPGRRADLAQRHAVDAALGEEALGDEDDLLLGRGRDHRHGWITARWTVESQLS